MKKICLTVLFQMALCCIKASGVNFYSINSIYGLSIRDTNSICKDKNGFIWTSSKSGVLRVTDSDYSIYQLPFTTADVFSVKLVYKNDVLYAFSNNGQVFRYYEIYDRFSLITDIRPLVGNNTLLIIHMVVDNSEGLWPVSTTGLYPYRANSVVHAN